MANEELEGEVIKGFKGRRELLDDIFRQALERLPIVIIGDVEEHVYLQLFSRLPVEEQTPSYLGGILAGFFDPEELQKIEKLHQQATRNVIADLEKHINNYEVKFNLRLLERVLREHRAVGDVGYLSIEDGRDIAIKTFKNRNYRLSAGLTKDYSLALVISIHDPITNMPARIDLDGTDLVIIDRFGEERRKYPISSNPFNNVVMPYEEIGSGWYIAKLRRV